MVFRQTTRVVHSPPAHDPHSPGAPLREAFSHGVSSMTKLVPSGERVTSWIVNANGSPHSNGALHSPSRARGLPQKEILEHEFPIAAGEWTAAR